MQTKQFLLSVLIYVCLTIQAIGQTYSSEKIVPKYKKVYLSVRAGKDYSIGTSNAGFIFNKENNYYPVPYTSGFGASFNGVYFFSRNYGAGMKYHFYSTRFDDKETFDYYNEFTQYSFAEMTHFAGAAIYGRWTFGTSKWEATSDIAVGYVHNKLADMRGRVYNWMHEAGQRQQYPNIYLIDNMTDQTVGVMFSAGIQYQITSIINIGVSGHGMFASLSKQNTFDIHRANDNVSRKLNRIGLYAGFGFKF